MKKRSKYSGLQRRKAISGYLFILPFIIGFLVFMVRPFFDSIYMSFTAVDLSVSPVAKNWIALENYKTAFLKDIDFSRMVTEGMGRLALYSVAIIVFSFFTALILNQKFRGRAFVRSVFFLPVIMSSGVVIGLETNNALLSGLQTLIEESGSANGVSVALQNILTTSGIGSKLFDYVFQVVDGIYDVAMASGIQIIIFLSGLQTISASMYEAADIEGCTTWEKLWKITFPMISSIFLVNWIYTVVDFSMRSDNEVLKKISDTMFLFSDYGLASAFSWSYFGITIVIIAVSSFLISKGVYYYE